MPINPDLYKAIVRITKTSDPGRHGSLGSGVVFGPTGLVITNNHVIEDTDFGTAFGQIKVELLDRVDQPPSKQVPAEVVIRNEIYDLAVLRIIGPVPPYYIDLLATPGGGASLMERRIRVLGYPPIGGATLTVTRGIVSGFDEAGNLKTDAEINPGNSGGAVLDDFDTFFGIPSFVVSEAGGKLGIIIQLDRIKDWFKSALKSSLPATPDELSRAFARSNLNFTGDNLGRGNKYARILGKFAAVEDLLERHEYERAIPHINFIMEKRPRSALAHHYLGNALLGLGRYIEAADQYQIALTYNPQHVPALGNWGVALLHLGRRIEALQIFEETIDRSEDPAELWAAYFNIARIYEDSGQEATANLYREKAAGLRAVVEEWFAERKRRRHPGDKIAALADAIVYAEIETGKQET